jgi:hypothetical protein
MSLTLAIMIHATAVMIDFSQSRSSLHACPAHHPPGDVLVADPADGDHPPVPVAGALFAADGPLADPIGERQRRLLPATVRLAGDGAELLGLRRVDAVQADALAADFDGVAVEDARPAEDVGVRGG